MHTLCRTYPTEDEARTAVDLLLAAGFPGDDLRVITGTTTVDHREAPVGSFAGATAESVGTFAGSEGSTADTMGAFAGDGDQRRGSFGDIDREMVTSYHAGVPHVRVATHRNLLKLLVDAGLDRAAAETDVESLHAGRVLLLFRTDDPDEVAATIDG